MSTEPTSKFELRVSKNSSRAGVFKRTSEGIYQIGGVDLPYEGEVFIGVDPATNNVYCIDPLYYKVVGHLYPFKVVTNRGLVQYYTDLQG